jgi:flagellar basal-body rod modification protein FlgD
MVNSVSAATDATTGAAAMKQTAGMNKDDFLKLFITQLKNQDPLKPQDGTEFIAQLAQLTQVEQSYNTNSNLQKLMNLQGNGNAMSAVSFIGKDVLAVGDQLSVTGGQPTALNFSLAGPANSVVLDVLNATGSTVKTMTLGATAAGNGQATWDGKDANGLPVANGGYQLRVTAVDATGTKTAGTALMQGPVNAVKLDGTTPVLTINGVDVALTDVLRVKGA